MKTTNKISILLATILLSTSLNAGPLKLLKKLLFTKTETNVITNEKKEETSISTKAKDIVTGIFIGSAIADASSEKEKKDE